MTHGRDVGHADQGPDGAVALTLLAGRAGPAQQAPAVCMLHTNARLSVCPGQAVIQTQELGSFSSNRHTKTGEVFTFRPELRKRLLFWGLPTG